MKEKEAEGYAYEGADALSNCSPGASSAMSPFISEVERFRVDVERRHNAQGEL